MSEQAPAVRAGPSAFSAKVQTAAGWFRRGRLAMFGVEIFFVHRPDRKGLLIPNIRVFPAAFIFDGGVRAQATPLIKSFL